MALQAQVVDKITETLHGDTPTVRKYLCSDQFVHHLTPREQEEHILCGKGRRLMHQSLHISSNSSTIFLFKAVSFS